MHGATLLDASDQVLRPTILWNDGRCAAECAELHRRVPDLAARTGNIAMTGFTAPKLLWVAQHESAVFARTRTVLLPKDWLRLCLTGERVGEMSDASGTLWLDTAARRWDGSLLAACELSENHMPRLVEGSAASGTLRPALAASWGVSPTVVVAGGGGDNAASAVGVGAVRDGAGFLSLGTSGVLFTATDQLRAAPERTLHAFCHALPGRWHAMAVTLSAGLSLSWVAGLLGRDVAPLVAEAEAWAADPKNIASAPFFRPYLTGERTPHNDPSLTAAFTGMRVEHGPAALVYAVLEGVAFAFADCMDVMSDAGARPESCLVVGGGARSPFWLGQIAGALQMQLQVSASGAGAALGAARLAMLATQAGTEAEICAVPPIARTIEPGADPAERLARWRVWPS
jgi:xylulokinase